MARQIIEKTGKYKKQLFVEERNSSGQFVSSEKNHAGQWADKKVKDWDKDGKPRKKGSKSNAKPKVKTSAKKTVKTEVKFDLPKKFKSGGIYTFGSDGKLCRVNVEGDKKHLLIARYDKNKHITFDRVEIHSTESGYEYAWVKIGKWNNRLMAQNLTKYAELPKPKPAKGKEF